MTPLRAALLAFAALLPFAPPAWADTLIDHVNGITPDGKGGVEHFSSIIVGNDGRILLVLRAGEPHPRTDYAVDAKGAVLLPGLIDAHAHMMDLGFAALTLDLSDTHSLAEAQAKIAAYAAAHPDRPWILGTGWDQERWGLKDDGKAGAPSRFPTAAELDAAVTDRPVWLLRSDGHTGWANGKAMELAGITAATKAPEGGRIERLTAADRPPASPVPRTRARPAVRTIAMPSGIFIDAAKALIGKAVPPPRPEDRDLALATAQNILLRHGITTICDMATPIEDWQAFRRAGDSGRLTVRIIAYADGIDNMILIGGPGPTPWLYDDHLRLAGVQFSIDGALGSRTAYLKAPYSDAPGETGTPRLTDTQLKNLMSRAAMDHFQVAVDATGDAANAELLDAIANLTDTYKGERRWRVEHARIIDPADRPRFTELAARAGGLALSIQPLRQAEEMPTVAARLGPDRLADASSWRSLAADNDGARTITLAFGSDAPAAPPDPFAAMAAARDENAQGGPLSPEAALAAYTTGSAWAGFADSRIGRIAPGLRADFLLVDRDPLQASSTDLAKTKILQVWIGGQQVYKADEHEGRKEQDHPAPPEADDISR